MVLKISFICACIVFYLPASYFWPVNHLSSYGEEFTPVGLTRQNNDFRTARVQPDQTVIVMPNQGRNPSPYGYGSSMSRGPTVVVNVPDNNYNRAANIPYTYTG